MKNTFYILALILLSPLEIEAQSFQNFQDGISLGSGPDTYFYSWPNGLQSGTAVETQQGGIVLYSGRSQTSNGAFDGGVSLYGKPISMILSADGDPTNPSVGTFDVWRNDDYWSGQNLPVFRIDTGVNTAQFDSLNVSITGGQLSINGSSALTASTASSILSTQGFIQQQSLATNLGSISPPLGSTWTNVYVPRGNVAPVAGQNIGGLLALGASTASGAYSFSMGVGTTASGSYSFAAGAGTTKASAAYSKANGYNASASGLYSSANGNSVTASGWYSYANGWGVSAKSSGETVFGRYNRESAPLSSTIAMNDLDGLFRLGNGASVNERSDALTVLKNGETTLSNKAWKANVASPLENPPSATDSGGNALVVDGHAVLNGKVIISVPQGDISMGIYE